MSSKPSKSRPSSSSIIAALQRASFGTAALPSTSTSTNAPLSDADIAALIAREAAEKEKVWREYGLGAYRSTPDPAPSAAPKPTTNKRFLSSMIRSVDEHNQTLLRQQALAARGSREAAVRGSPAASGSRRREEERGRERREDRTSRGGGMRAWSDDEPVPARRSRSPDREANGKRHAQRRRSPDPPHDDYDHRWRSHRERSGSRSAERHRGDQRRSARRREEDSEDEAMRRRRRRKERERLEDEEDAERRRRRKERDRDRHLDEEERVQDSSSRSRPDRTSSPAPKRSPPPVDPDTAEPGPFEPPAPSKMDRYFEDSYDPRLDVAPVPKAGLVGEGYERMLAVLEEKEREKEEARRRAKREKKAAAKAAERALRKAQKNVLGFSSSSSDSDSSVSRRRSARKAARKAQKLEEKKPPWLVEMEQRERGVMDMVYKKRGEEKAWDKGKVDVVEQLARGELKGVGTSGEGSYDY